MFRFFKISLHIIFYRARVKIKPLAPELAFCRSYEILFCIIFCRKYII
ncbi:hypothetical protein CAMGR0001_1370 [Campylobacter gracilis RM3268]|uniref:Uncharacterized protein n=1 Tax=Campylobacter gracilis RM3268 TaxID=553220 RepID=C8PJH0_9BACT|nr:hypothetical protein CAMGR0001_1370 [Campylobacter gracilis RM3268]